VDKQRWRSGARPCHSGRFLQYNFTQPDGNKRKETRDPGNRIHERLKKSREIDYMKAEGKEKKRQETRGEKTREKKKRGKAKRRTDKRNQVDEGQEK